jgi:membrane protein DedA with SNARE-associated domain
LQAGARTLDLEVYVKPVLDFVRAYPQYSILIVFLIAFGECFAFLSWLVPGTFFFVAFGTFAGASNLNLLPLSIAAGVGAASGFYTSYLLGKWLGPTVAHKWPFKDKPEVLARGHAFFEKWGAPGIFIGHFFGPVRAIVALVAGILTMPQVPFHIANLSASALWGFAMFYGTGKAGEMMKTYLGFMGGM